MQSVDGDTAQVPPQIAEDLGIDQVAYAQDVHTEPRLRFRRIGAEVTDPNVVPVPAAAWLLAGGVAALGALRRRKA